MRDYLAVVGHLTQEEKPMSCGSICVAVGRFIAALLKVYIAVGSTLQVHLRCWLVARLDLS